MAITWEDLVHFKASSSSSLCKMQVGLVVKSINTSARTVTLLTGVKLTFPYEAVFGWDGGHWNNVPFSTYSVNVGSNGGTKWLVQNQEVTCNYDAAGKAVIKIPWEWDVDLDSMGWLHTKLSGTFTPTTFTVNDISPQTYTITYNANGGNASSVPEPTIKTYNVATKLSTTKPTHATATKLFYRWCAAKDGSASLYPAGSAVLAGFNKNITFYAIWGHRVKYDLNGGDSGAPSTQVKSPLSADVDPKSDLTLRSEVPIRKGYKFLHWNTVADDSGTEYSPGGTYTAEKAITLYAQWSAYTHTFKYNVNGGRLTSASIYSVDDKGTILKTDGTAAYTLKAAGDYLEPIHATKGLTADTTFKLVRDGYTFKGWSVNSTGSPSYEVTNVALTPYDLTKTVPTANTTVMLYAAWSKNVYTIYYDENGGTWYNSEGEACNGPGTEKKEHGVNLKLTNTTISKIGYTFAGWSDGKGNVYPANGTFTANENTTLTAIWNPNKVTLYYNTNGGMIGSETYTTMSEGNVDDIIIYANTSEKVSTVIEFGTTKGLYNATGNTPSCFHLTKSGHRFLGWKMGSTGVTIFDQDVDYSATNFGSIPIVGTPKINISSFNETLYAAWEREEYQIQFDANGGTGGPSSFTAEYDQLVTLSTKIPTKAGGTFSNWNTSKDGYGTSYSPGATFKLTEPLTLYAIWEAHTYTITYDANGGNVNSLPAPQEKVYDTPLPLSTKIPTRTNYKFSGWNTQSDNLGTNYSAGATYTKNESVTLYAQWATALTKCGEPSNLSIVDNDDNTLTLSCQVGTDGIGNIATAVEFKLSWEWGPNLDGEGYSEMLVGQIPGMALELISTEFTYFVNVPRSVIDLFFYEEDGTMRASVRLYARTLGNAGKGYYSDWVSASQIDMIYYLPVSAPIIVQPAFSGEIHGKSTNYHLAWTGGESSINNEVTGYSIKVFDETTGAIKNTYTTQNSFYDIPLAVFEADHTYHFCVTTLGTNGINSKEVKSKSILVKDIQGFGSIMPEVFNVGTMPTAEIDSYTTFFNPGFGTIMKIEWQNPVSTNNKLKHFILTIRDEVTATTILNKAITRETSFYVTADMLNNCPAGMLNLSISVSAVSQYGEAYSSQIAVPLYVKCVNKCAGAYATVTAGYERSINKRAVAFVKVPDSKSESGYTWKPALGAYTRDFKDNWQPSDIQYEVLYDNNGYIIVDINDEPIYTM